MPIDSYTMPPRAASQISTERPTPLSATDRRWSSVRRLAQSLGALVPELTRYSANWMIAQPAKGTDKLGGAARCDALRFKQQHLAAAMAVLDQFKAQLPADRIPKPLRAATDHLNHLAQISAAECSLTEGTPHPNGWRGEHTLRQLIGGKKKAFTLSASGLAYLKESKAYFNAGLTGHAPPKINQHIHIRLAMAAYLRGVFKASQLDVGNGPPKAIDKLLIQAWIDTLNRQDWAPLEHASELDFTGQDGQTLRQRFVTQQTPAAHLCDSLRAQYRNTGVQGICSYATREYRHAINLWRTQFEAQNTRGNTRLFSGLRHGVHDAYGYGGHTTKRTQANDARVKEFVQACLTDRLSRRALSAEETDAGEIHLPIVSVSLLTRLGKESEMIKQQMDAFERIQKTGVNILVQGHQGRQVSMMVKPRFLPFNVPVNRVALHPTGEVLGIWQNADAINSTALEALIGSLDVNREVGGLAGDALASARLQLNDLKRQEPLPPEQLATQAELVRSIEWITTLVAQVRTIVGEQSHHRVGHEPYKLAVRLLALANECNVTPAFNCKSGKDRTGQLHVEIRDFYADSWAYGRPRPVDQPRSGWARLNYTTLFTQGGDRQVQALNTGVPGSKSQLPYYNDLLGVSRRKIDAIQGLSKWVGT